MKVEFEKNITVMKTLGIFLVTATKVYIDYAREIGINLPMKIFLVYTLYPVVFILMYPLFIQVKRNMKKKEVYFKFLNDLMHINFVFLGFFIIVLITMEFWNKWLLTMIYFSLGILLINSLIMFLSLLISWLYLFLVSDKNETFI